MNTIIKQKSRLRLIAVAAGCLFLSGSVAMAQAVRQDTPEASAPNATPISVTTQPVTAPSIDDDVIMMSPFQVDATKEKGYFAENTLAGSRMRTNIADLGAAISVVTKQQLEDTGSLDVNDIFRYEIGTEGSTSYTPSVQSMRSDGIADTIAGATFGNSMTASTNSTANRVRGLGSPSFALNYYQTISQVPFDSYNAASFEINRGPNSMLFGMGSPAGIVNQSTASAQINKNNASVQIRIDDRGSNRVSLSFNKMLVKDKLAIYGALLYNDQQFERKPSYDISRRQYGAITYTPFRRTKITASVEGYNNDNRRPNNLTPVDGVSEWRNAGKPYYNLQSQQIVSAVTGAVITSLVPSQDSSNATPEYRQAMIDKLAAAGYTYLDHVPSATELGDGQATKKYWDVTATSTNKNNLQFRNEYNTTFSIYGTGHLTNLNSPFYVPGIAFQNGRSVMQIADGGLQNWIHGQGGGRHPASFNGTNTVYAFDTQTPARGGNEGSTYVYNNADWATAYDSYYSQSGVWSRADDYSGILAMKYDGVTDRSIYDWKNVNILAMNFGNQRNTNYNIELEQEIIPDLLHFSAGWFRQDFDSMQSYTVAQMNATTLYVDTSKYYPDGTENHYFGKTYVMDTDPDRYEDSQTVDQYRAMLAFTPDFTKNKNWTKWLGRHQFMALASYMDWERTTVRRRLEYASGSAEGKLRYMRNPNSPGWNMQNTSLQRYFYLSDIGDTVTQSSGGYDADIVNDSIRVYDYTTSQWKDVDVSMIWNAFDSGTERFARLLTSYSAGWTGYFWDDRLITTFGVRRDFNRTRGVSNAGMSNAEKWVDGYYQYGEVFKRWGDWFPQSGSTTTVGGVLKPFLGWDFITKRSGNSVLWEAIENLGFSYNKSDNFDASAVPVVDLFRNALPKATGTGKDYGVQTTLFKGKLYARLNWYEATNENAVMEAAGTAMERLWWHVDSTAYRSWLSNIWLIKNNKIDLDSSTWKAEAKKYTKNGGDSGASYVAAKAEMQQWVAEQWKLSDWDYYQNMGGLIRGTSTSKAKGVELTVQYNPTPNWTIKVTAAKNKATYDNVLKEFDAWEAIRKPLWDAADAAILLPGNSKIGQVITTGDNSDIYLGSFWDSYGYYDFTADSERGGTTVTAGNASGWTNNLNYYNAVVSPQIAALKALRGQISPGQREYNVTVVTNYAFDRGTLKGWSVGGAQRYASKTIIGYHGKAALDNYDTYGDLKLDVADTTRPVYDDPLWVTDLWIAYTRKIFNDKVRMKLQLNVADVFEDGGLKPVAVNYDGKPYAYRIVDPRTFILTATFDF
jgi:hypothetical protein